MIFACLPDTWLWRFTFGLAFTQFRAAIHYYRNPDDLLSLQAAPDVTVFFTDENPDFNNKHLRAVRHIFPNAAIFMFGSDTIYLGGQAGIPWDVDLYIETNKSVVSSINRFPARHFYWSISEVLISNIKTTPPAPKQNTAVCLCNACSDKRIHFLTEVNEHIPVVFDRNCYKINEVVDIYAASRITLGHTMPVFNTRTERSMKGFRDWIGPVCDSLLICDDYPDIIDTGVVPTYKYGDADDAVSLMLRLLVDKQERQSWLEKQRAWVDNNTIEKQLNRIFKERGWGHVLGN